MEPATNNALPTDPASRARLWREWIQLDAPQSAPSLDRPRVERRRMTSPIAATSRAAAAAGDWLDEVIDRPAGVVAGLSTAVRESLVDGELPASDRERIVSRASRLGINRFEATLLIATVQHRARNEAGVAPSVTYVIPARSTWGVGKLLTCVLAAEAIVASVGYILWSR